jgi:hypothetical protein
MKHPTADSLPPHVLRCMRPADREALGIARKPDNAPVLATDPGKDAKATVKAVKGRKGPNQTEMRYMFEALRGLDARYEALTVRLANGHRYTPDWVVFGGGRPIACYEVKGPYRLGSQDGARMRFDQARLEWPGVRWVWATWTGNEWQEEAYG